MLTLAKRVSMANGIASYKTNLKGIAAQMSSIKSQLESVKAVIDADADFTAEDKADALAMSSFVNNVKYTDLIDFINTNV